MLPYYKPPTPSEPEPELPEDPDPEGVNLWRYENLIEAGWSDLLASVIALDHGVDLHRACEVRLACADESTAWRIVRPW